MFTNGRGAAVTADARLGTAAISQNLLANCFANASAIASAI
jgi:hypothetical protein